MPQDYELITNKDLDELAYNECVKVTTIIGTGIGAFSGAGAFSAPGAIIGAVLGHAFGAPACRALAPEIRKKFFTKSEPLNKDEVSLIVNKIKTLYPGTTKQQALHVLAAIRFETLNDPWSYNSLV